MIWAVHEYQPNEILAEYCELLNDATGEWLTQGSMYRTFQWLNLP